MSKYAQFLIEEFFNMPQDFIMYTGGSGGEHLVVKLKLYSNKYRDDSIVFNTSQGVNRWHIMSNPFINALGSEYSSRWKAPHIRDWSTAAFAEIIVSSMSRQYDYRSICNIIENSIMANLDLNSTPLYRKHISGYSPFNENNTIVIDACDPIWTDYSRLLFAYKTLHREYKTTEILLSRLRKIPFYIHDRKDMLIEYVLSHDMSNIVVNESKIALICSTYKYTPEEILNMSPRESVMLYVNDNMDIKSKITDLNHVKSNRRIVMNNMFDKGYMEDMFEIDNQQFHYEMLEWHERNLELLSSNGHDIEQWKLK